MRPWQAKQAVQRYCSSLLHGSCAACQVNETQQQLLQLVNVGVCCHAHEELHFWWLTAC
jgi:hypothetical protein